MGTDDTERSGGISFDPGRAMKRIVSLGRAHGAFFMSYGMLAGTISQAGAQQGECVHEELRAFDFMAGEWHVEAHTRFANGEWEHTEARSVIRPLFQTGCVLVETYTGTRSGQPFEARGTTGFNMISGRLQFEWIDSEHGVLSTFEGGMQDDTLVLDFEMVLRGNPVTLRQVFFDVQSASFRHEDRRSIDDGRTWFVTGRSRYTRRPGDRGASRIGTSDHREASLRSSDRFRRGKATSPPA